MEDGEGFAVNTVNFKVNAVYALKVFGRHHFVNGSLCGDPAILESADHVGIKRREIDFVKHQNHGLAQFVAKAPDELHHLRGVIDVEIVGGFVEQHILSVLSEHHCNEGALALAARHFVNKAVGKGFELHVVDGLIDLGPIIS